MTIIQDKTDPTGVRDTSPAGSSSAIRARERKAAAALALRKDNVSWDEIAEVLGYPTARAALVAVEQMLEKGALTPESQEFLRALAASRLEELIYAGRQKALDDQAPDQLAAMGQVRQLIETHMKLLGYAAPQELAIYNPLEGEVQEFIAMVQQRKAGKQLEESDIFSTEADESGVYHVTGVDEGHYGEDEPEPEPAEPDYLKDF